eukprot:gene15263-4568_t
MSEGCQDGWIYHRGHCYGYGPEKVAWHEARENCRALNADLTTIHGEWELKFLLKEFHFGRGDGTRFWVGGRTGSEDGPMSDSWRSAVD